MKVKELGEFGLIDLMAEIFELTSTGDAPRAQDLVMGIGDDAAAWHTTSHTQLATTDSLVQGVHFPPDIPPRDLGWRALAANLSDIAAMGGKPTYVLVSLGLPGDSEVGYITDVCRGMSELALIHGAAIAGGDTTESPVIAVTITVLGEARQGHILTRHGAEVGDAVAVTGRLGAAAAGLAVFEGRSIASQDTATRLRTAFLHPQPRLAEGGILARGGAKAAIDISDGLIADLGHICLNSSVGARIETARLPIDADVKEGFGSEALAMALAGGEDYELIFTADVKAVEGIKAQADIPVSIIGEIVADEKRRVILIDEEGNPTSPPHGGWEHFKTQ